MSKHTPRARVTPGIVWPSGHYPRDQGPDPADGTLMTGAEHDSRMRLKLMSAAGRAELLAAAEKKPGLYPEWLRSELGLCVRCERPVHEDDRTTCELCRGFGAEEDY